MARMTDAQRVAIPRQPRAGLLRAPAASSAPFDAPVYRNWRLQRAAILTQSDSGEAARLLAPTCDASEPAARALAGWARGAARQSLQRPIATRVTSMAPVDA